MSHVSFVHFMEKPVHYCHVNRLPHRCYPCNIDTYLFFICFFISSIFDGSGSKPGGIFKRIFRHGGSSVSPGRNPSAPDRIKA